MISTAGQSFRGAGVSPAALRLVEGRTNRRRDAGATNPPEILSFSRAALEGKSLSDNAN